MVSMDPFRWFWNGFIVFAVFGVAYGVLLNRMGASDDVPRTVVDYLISGLVCGLVIGWVGAALGGLVGIAIWLKRLVTRK